MSALPVVSLPLSEIGRRMEDRMAFRAAGVSGTIQPDNTIVLTGQMARAVITGVCAGACESYGGQPVSRVTMPAAGPLVAAAQ